jgi:hypothetical protein
MEFSAQILDIRRLDIRARIVVLLGMVQVLWGVVMIQSIIFIGSRGAFVIFLLLLRRTDSADSCRHPSKETMRIMADYVEEVLTTCHVV